MQASASASQGNSFLTSANSFSHKVPEDKLPDYTSKAVKQKKVINYLEHKELNMSLRVKKKIKEFDKLKKNKENDQAEIPNLVEKQ